FNVYGHLKNNRKFSRFIKLTITDNFLVKEILINKYEENNIKVIESGIDINIFKPSIETSNRELGPFIIGFLGRLSPEKNPNYIIEIAKLLKEHTNIKFFIYGDGPMYNEILNSITTNGLNRTVELKGFVNNISAFKDINLLFMPSHIEGRPFAAMESLSSGIPVLASTCGGIKELIKHNVNGLLFNLEDLELVKNYIIDLSSNKIEYRKLSDNARKFAIKYLDSKRMNREYRDTIHSILNQ
ncbi:MAG: glycosyltransferase family 4 protein, partial [Candidatus Roizmanbacteria bacterium]